MINILITTEDKAWNAFVAGCPEATVFHSFNWAAALAKGAGHRPYFLSALDAGEIVGVLPLCLMQSRLFGKYLVSLPHYLGGVCAVNHAAEAALLEYACKLADELKVNALEIRGNNPLPSTAEHFNMENYKASFLVDLSAGEEALWKSQRKQTRNRVRKGQQHGLALLSGHDLLEDFWRIFSLNTRAIGSVTFGKEFFNAILQAFGDDVKILAAVQNNTILAAKLTVRFRDTLTMLWGGTTPHEKADGVNYWLTWETLRYALATGCNTLDMGRSTMGSGPYQFKAHWGGKELRHYWYTYPARRAATQLRAESPRFRLARTVWRRLPLSLTRCLGPWIARQIP
jgi:FemAB-related protein (PEP-CTERM system-associated)